MTITKNQFVDKIETVKIDNYYGIQIREKISISETDDNGNSVELSSKYHRYALSPDADISSINDSLVLNIFNLVMTDTVKANYQAFLESQNAETNPE